MLSTPSLQRPGRDSGKDYATEKLKFRIRTYGVLPQFMLSHLSHHLCTGVLVPLLPLLRQDFQLSYFRSGLLTSSFSIAYGLAQLPIATISDRIGKRTVIILGLLGISLSGIAAGLTRNYSQLLIGLVLMGLFGSSYHASSSSFLSQSFSQEKRGQMLGLHLVGGNLSFMLTPFLAVLIARFSGSWRFAFSILALPALLAGFLLWSTVRGREEREVGLISISVGGEPVWWHMLRTVGLLLGVALLLQLITFSIYSFLPLYLVDKHRVSFEQAGVMTGVMIGVGVIGSPLGGTLSDHMGRQRVILISVISAGPLLYLFTLAPFGSGVLALLTLYGLVMSFRMPAIESLIADFVPSQRRATALATYYFFSQETSSVIAPLVGRLIDLQGMDPVFRGLALAACALSVVVLFGKRW
jgi:FSR family fosmidomycin resistance protein-like MFS transporter